MVILDEKLYSCYFLLFSDCYISPLICFCVYLTHSLKDCNDLMDQGTIAYFLNSYISLVWIFIGIIHSVKHNCQFTKQANQGANLNNSVKNRQRVRPLANRVQRVEHTSQDTEMKAWQSRKLSSCFTIGEREPSGSLYPAGDWLCIGNTCDSLVLR